MGTSKATEANTATIAIYSTDPPALTSFHSFDPESFALIPAINDALIVIGLGGEVEPGLALSWSQHSPTEMDFELRQGVFFHNGDLFGPEDVVETFRAHREPQPSACGGGILSPIVDCVQLGPSTVRLVTAFPDAMLLRRLFFGQIYPKSVLLAEGRDAFVGHPIGTGAYEFVHWKKGEEIALRRNTKHWAGKATVDTLYFPIVRQKEWVGLLERGKIDIALNIDSHDAIRASRRNLHVEHQDAALSQWFLLANKGPLADKRVRQALNHAIDQSILVDAIEHGWGEVQRSVATKEQEGYSADVRSYRYSPALARKLLAEAGYPNGFTLRGLVAETSTAVFAGAREFLARIGVTLEADVVPRSAWIGEVVVSRLMGNPGYAGDFALASVDNPLGHSLFHQFIFLFSEGPFSLTNSPEYDQKFLAAATAVGDGAQAAQEELEAYARDEALMLFTVQQHVCAATRPGYTVRLPASGHFDATALWSIEKDASVRPAGPLERAPHEVAAGDLGHLYDATSQLGMFYLPDSSELGTTSKRIWRNLESAQERTWLQNEPMMKSLVSLAEASSNLDSVLGSTERVAIAGYSLEGHQIFSNAGFDKYFGADCSDVRSYLGKLDGELSWRDIAKAVDQGEVWSGPVVLPSEGRPEGAPTRLLLSVTHSHDREVNVTGYTLVFNDFSGAEERIRSKAIRVLLDHVEFGLCRVSPDGTILAGFSSSCTELFVPDLKIEGAAFTEALGLNEREAGHFECCYMQIVDDFLPEEVSVGQLPTRIPVGSRTLSVSGSVIRDDEGTIDSVLFSVADITELIEAEKEAQRMTGVLRVLQFRNRFEEFLQGLDTDLQNLEVQREMDAATYQRECRIVFHTAKGVFSQYGIATIAEAIHVMEDSEILSRDHVSTLRTAVAHLVAENKSVWGITLDARNPTFEVSEVELAGFEAAVANRSDAEVAEIALQFARSCREKTVGHLIGPVGEASAFHAQKRGKQIKLEVTGETVRVPPSSVGVFDVLTHLLRNSIDHGVEEPLAREAKGKPATGTIRIEVSRCGDDIELVISDDGAGIDADRVAASAVDKGVITSKKAENMSDDDKRALIFEAGFSTSGSVTDTSGRGVGMSAVRDVVERLGGTVRIVSEAEVGTSMIVRVPGALDGLAQAAG